MPHSPALSVEEWSVFVRNMTHVDGIGLTEARLIRDDMSRNERNVAGEALWTFMDIEERPKSMPSAVLIGGK
jgi:hypothetical protein